VTPSRALLLAVLLGTAAQAGNPKAVALAKEADKLYRASKYLEAAEVLRQAYQVEPNAVYLFNIARAYDQAGDFEQASEHYRRYVGLPSEETQPELLKKANLAMDRLRTLAARAEAERRLQEGERKRLEDERQKAEARAQDEARAAEAQRRAYEARDRAAQEAARSTVSARMLATLVTGGVAVAALGTSLGFAVAAQGSRDAFRRATTLPDKQGLEAATRTQAAVTDVALVLGLASTAAALVLFPRGAPALAGSVSVALSPLPGGGGLATLGGVF
jgi:tetratricopeptide (TPR) repeat protein